MSFKMILPTSVFNFNNNLKRTNSPTVTFSQNNLFDNSITINTKESFNLSFSETLNFNSARVVITEPLLNFSTGLIDYPDASSIIGLPDSTFEDINKLVTNTSVTSYWFDNSIPSKVTSFQTRLIPLGNFDSRLQFSIRMPSYDYNLEYNVLGVNITNNTDFEMRVFPYTSVNETINIEYNAEFEDYGLNWEWIPGDVLTAAVNIEYNRIPVTVYPINFEFFMGFASNLKTNFEYKNVVNETEANDIEFFIENISYFYRNNFEFYVGKESLENLGFEITSEFGTSVNFQTLSFAPYDSKFSFEYVPSRVDDDSINIEFKNVYIDDYSIDFESYAEINTDIAINNEYYVSTINRTVDFEFKNVYNDDYCIGFESDTLINKEYIVGFESFTPEIWKDYNTSFEFKNIYNDDYSIVFESSVPDLNKQYPLNIETLTFTEVDNHVNFEVFRTLDIKTHLQTYVIPVTFGERYFQVYIISSSNPNVEFEYNITDITSDRIQNIEYKIEINDTKVTNFEISIPSLNKDYSLSFESDTVINKNFELALDYIGTLPTDIGFDIESFVGITEKKLLNIEFIIESLNKEYSLNLESYIEINTDNAINIEILTDTIKKTLNIEFDVLDLVYYVISKGYNILPWGYSDGLGFWDNTVNKNWNKTEDITTFKQGLLNQLQDKSLTIPDLIQYSDKSLDNFGVFIPGVSNENIHIQDKVLYYESNEDYTLVLGKKKKESLETIQLKQGNNLIIWDGVYNANSPAFFNTEIKQHILNEFNHTMLWRQDLGQWVTLINEDHALYYTIDIDGQTQPIPFIIVINVSDDCSFEIKR